MTNLRIFLVEAGGTCFLDGAALSEGSHRSLVVEVYNNRGEIVTTVKYDAIYNNEKKLIARKQDFIPVADFKKRSDCPDAKIVELDATSFSLERADAYVEEVNELQLDYNPVTDSPVRYVLIIQSNVESGPKMIQFNIQSKMNSEIFIQ